LAISQGMSVHPVETLAICLIHWFGMTLWLSILENTVYATPPKEGKLGKILAQIPLEKLKLETLANVGIEVKAEALAKVGALNNLLTQTEIKSEVDMEDEVEVEVHGCVGAREEAKEAGKIEAPEDVKKPCEGSGITIKKIFFSSVFGLIYIFAYVSIIEKPTRNKYAFYYFVWFLETCFFLIIECQELVYAEAWLFLCLRAATLGMALVGLVIMIFYVLYYHQSLWAKKEVVSGGSGLENVCQYGLASLGKIDPSLLIPLKSIDASQFIPTLDSIPGTQLI